VTSFVAFCQERGLVIRHLVSGAVKRVPTLDKPRSRNGAYFFGGRWGWVQNWANMDQTENWFADGQNRHDPALLRDLEESRQREDRRRQEDAIRAEQKAAGMISEAILMDHPYLISKGLPEAKGLVLDQTLLVRMEDARGNLVGLQTIEMVSGEWRKKMLFGMKAKGASLKLSRGEWPILCEGLATGLSIQEALKTTRMNAFVVVCFSAGNLVEVAKRYPNARVFADNDVSKAGQEAAEKSGCPWIMSDVEGEDANDLWRRDPSGLACLLVKLRRIPIRK
jgi:putative DNA primase/helicase